MDKVNCELLHYGDKSWLSATGIIDLLRTPEANQLSPETIADTITESIFKFEMENMDSVLATPKPSSDVSDYVVPPRSLWYRLLVCWEIIRGRKLKLGDPS